MNKKQLVAGLSLAVAALASGPVNATIVTVYDDFDGGLWLDQL